MADSAKWLNLLVVDDDPLVLQAIQMSLPEQWRMNGVHKPGDIPKQKTFHAALVDMHLSGNLERAEGIELIKTLRQLDPHLEIVAMSGNLDRDLMEKCLKAGASRFLAKPLSPEELLLTLEKIEAWFLLQGATLRGQKRELCWVGRSSSSEKIKRQIAELMNEPGPILIEGESGTGKDVVASMIHRHDQGAPFIPVNVAGIPENLFESELFGHVRGAFTGADQNKMGLAEAAHGGDLFLDEIEALSPALQVKLLRFLESGEVRRVGGKDVIQVKTRVIIATNKNLEQMAREGAFREDLLWRINGKKITLPPLRDRRDDIKELAEHFMSMDRVRKKQLSEEAIQVLMDYSWPGNVRELKRACEQLILISPLPVIRAEDARRVVQPISSSNGFLSDIDFSMGLPDLLTRFESQVIKQCLDQYSDVDEVARRLKISRSSLYKKIKDHDIQWRAQ